MATSAEKKLAFEQWKKHCKRIQSITDTTALANETPVQKDRRKERLLSNYADYGRGCPRGTQRAVPQSGCA